MRPNTLVLDAVMAIIRLAKREENGAPLSAPPLHPRPAVRCESSRSWSRPRCDHRDKSVRPWSDPQRRLTVHDLNLVVGANDPDLALVGKVGEVTSRLNSLRDGDPANVRLTARLPHFAAHEIKSVGGTDSDIDRAVNPRDIFFQFLLERANGLAGRLDLLVEIRRGDCAILANAAGEWDGQRVIH